MKNNTSKVEKKNAPEAIVQREIVQYIRSKPLFERGFFICHIPNQILGYMASAHGGSGYGLMSYYEQQGYVRGVYDLIVFNPRTAAQFVFIEVKSKKGRLSDSQKAFQYQREELQGWVGRLFTVHSFDEFKEI